MKIDPDVKTFAIIVAMLWLILIILLFMKKKEMQKALQKGSVTTNSGVKIADIGEETQFPERTEEIPLNN